MKTIFRYTFTYKNSLLLLFIFIFIHSLTQLMLPTLMGNIVDNGVVVGDITYIWKIGLLMLFVAALGIVMSIVVSYTASKIAMSVGKIMRNDVFSKVTNFSLHQFDTIGTASLITRTTNDITQIQQALIMILRMFLTAPFMLIGGLILAFMKDFQLSLVILFAIPFIVLTVYFLLKKGYPLFQSVQQRLDQLNVVLRENLTGVRVIRSFTRQEDERKRLKKANHDLTDVTIRVNRLMAFTFPFMMLLMNVTIVLIIWFGGIRIEQGMLEIGDLMAYIQYVMLILMAIMMASMMFVMIPRASVSANRINEVLKVETVEKTSGMTLAKDNPLTVTFNNIQFAYPDAEQLVLKNINFTAYPGETTAIIGGTGSGKTTLIQLLLRFYEPNSGEILINGIPLNQLDEYKLREMIGYVPQKALLFTGTVTDNLRYGNEKARKEEIMEAAKIAQAHDFISKLPNEYETLIEQGGSNLSGGQKQRLSIARALIRKPSIYIFDDSFSALDYETDLKLRKALQKVTELATVFIVAQRISTIKHADQIIVLDQGEMVGKGTHEELLNNCEVYKEIVASQTGEGKIG
jgi:ATP-binding cassette subfamily B multidrug efflux pump